MNRNVLSLRLNSAVICICSV